MSASSNVLAQAKARKAALQRHRGTEDPATIAAGADLSAAKSAADIDRDIERLVASAPPLTCEQRDRLTVLLRSGDAP